MSASLRVEMSIAMNIPVRPIPALQCMTIGGGQWGGRTMCHRALQSAQKRVTQLQRALEKGHATVQKRPRDAGKPEAPPSGLTYS